MAQGGAGNLPAPREGFKNIKSIAEQGFDKTPAASATIEIHGGSSLFVLQFIYLSGDFHSSSTCLLIMMINSLHEWGMNRN